MFQVIHQILTEAETAIFGEYKNIKKILALILNN